ncbi:uncharacterized protein LOC110932536 [Helianthus annuus]|uniref:uncharacterized protein LOC110932536 n=1 Tax=Helianthus annuus TaxID=4232 RepID=UPI000B909B09|nr:uncharacterized protein LOC110932536 [Helianthus annuus]
MVWNHLSRWCKVAPMYFFEFKDLLKVHEYAGFTGRKKDILMGLIRIGSVYGSYKVIRPLGFRMLEYDDIRTLYTACKHSGFVMQGSSNASRSKKKLEEEKEKADKARILKFFPKLPQSSSFNVDKDNADVNVGEDNMVVNVNEANLGEDDVNVHVDEANAGEDDVDVNVNVNVNVDEANVSEDDANVNPSIDIFDPRNLDRLNPNLINELVKNGPKRDLTIHKGPMDKVGRRFSKFMYNSSGKQKTEITEKSGPKKPNRNKNQRQGYKKGGLDNEGYSDWKHASQGLKDHEVSFEHLKHMHQWFEINQRFNCNETIDKEAYEHFKKEKDFGKK